VVKYEVAADVPANDPLAFIVHDMEQNEHLRESSELAATMQQRLAAMHPGPNRGVKQAGFRVLLTALMPAVLVEIGFGTNPDEARYISSPAGQRKLAAAIAEAALRYLGQYERRMGAGGA
jgi:N-acetylmuramoyl-L-alanine amidase